jgi:hypothetical protein
MELLQEYFWLNGLATLGSKYNIQCIYLHKYALKKIRNRILFRRIDSAAIGKILFFLKPNFYQLLMKSMLTAAVTVKC